MVKASRNIKCLKNIQLDTNISVVLPIAGFGTKTKSFGSKSLLSIRGTTLLEHQLHNIYAVYPNAEVILVVGFEYHKIYKRIKDKYPVKFVYNPKYEEEGQALSILMGLHSCSYKSVLLIYGDILFNKSTIGTLQLNRSTIVIDTKYQLQSHKVGVGIADDQTVSMLCHGIKTKWSQIVMLYGIELSMSKDLLLRTDAHKWLGYEILNDVIKNGGVFYITEPKSQKILEINGIKDTL